MEIPQQPGEEGGGVPDFTSRVTEAGGPLLRIPQLRASTVRSRTQGHPTPEMPCTCVLLHLGCLWSLKDFPSLEGAEPGLSLPPGGLTCPVTLGSHQAPRWLLSGGFLPWKVF